MLLKNPVVTLVAVVTLAWELDATLRSSVSSMVFCFDHSTTEILNDLCRSGRRCRLGKITCSSRELLRLEKQNTVFEDVVTYGASSMTLTGDGEPSSCREAWSAPDTLPCVGVDPVRGRAFVNEEYEQVKET
jgi:hypothetical protein